MSRCIKTQARMDALVAEEMRAFRGGYNDGSGLTALQSAKAHRAAMTPERRAELDGEW